MADDVFKKSTLPAMTIVHGRYMVQKLIARGGMAFTYLAEDKKTGRLVVLKVLSLSRLENWKTLELFKREISVLKNINHPQVPDYIDHFEQKFKDDTCYILVQEYADGNNLYDLVKNGKKFTIREVRELLSNLLKILSVIHDLNPPVIHRDINPKNIILDKKGTVHLVDFSASGFIKKTTLAAAKSDTFVGTIGYMPPEQFYGKVMPESDLYALGVTIIFLLTGMDPPEFELTNLRLDYKPYVSLPVDLEELLDAMIDPDNVKRPGSADQALDILEKRYPEKGEDIFGKSIKKQEPVPPGLAANPLLRELFNAIGKNNRKKVKELVTSGVKLNPKNPEIEAPLHYALKLNQLKIAKILITHGADVNARFKGRALIHDAVLSNNIKQVLLLIKNKADINVLSGIDSKTAVEYAYKKGYQKLYNYLLSYGAINTVYNNKIAKPVDIPDPPRQVHFCTRALIKSNGVSEATGMIMFLLLVLPILFVPYLHVRRIIPSIRLLGADSSATGKIIKDKYSGDETWDGTSILIYYYEFTAKDNKHYTQYSFITDRIYSTGDMVNIHYTGSNPHFSFIKGGRYSPFNLDSVTTFIILLLLVLFGSMCWGLIFYNKPGAYRYIRFLKKGIFIHGEIVYKIKKFSKYHYFYKYKDEQNRMRKGKYKTWDKEFAQSGSHVPVLYVHGWFRKDSMVVRPPLMYRKGVWTLNTKDMFFGEKGAIVLAGIRHFLWVDFLVMTVFDVIFGI